MVYFCPQTHIQSSAAVGMDLFYCIPQHHWVSLSFYRSPPPPPPHTHTHIVLNQTPPPKTHTHTHTYNAPECVSGQHSLLKTPVGILPQTSQSEGKWQADRLAGKATLTSGLLLGRSEVLRSLRYYLWVQSQVPHTINCLEERGVERGCTRQSSFKGQERAVVNRWRLEPFQLWHPSKHCNTAYTGRTRQPP